MKRSENEKQKQMEETKETEQSSRFQSVVYYFDIFYRVVKALVILLIVVLLVAGSLGAGTAVGYFASLVHGSEIPEREEMVGQINDYTRKSSMYYADGSLISDVRSDLLRTPVPLEDVSELLIQAVVSTEDEYFFEHEGVVPKAVARALVQELSDSGATTGGSTLTQQLIKQQILSPEVTHERKANEILLAYHLENEVDKDEILEAYLNVSPFGRNNKGQNIAGVEEAAQGIFGVSASEVSLPQAAFIAGLPQRPIVFSPYTQYGEIKEDHELSLTRQREVIFRMYREGYITEEEFNEARAYDITQDFINQEDVEYDDNSYVYDLAFEESTKILSDKFKRDDEITDEMLEENPELVNEYNERAEYALRNQGYNVYTTIDKEIHDTLERVTAEYKDQLGGERSYTYEDDEGETHTVTAPVNTSGAMIDNQTGRVLGFIGGRDYNESQFNRAFKMTRSMGSVIKPLAVYGPAINENLLTPASIIPDTEVEVRNTWQNGAWTYHTPTNVGATTNNWLTARESLYDSKNIAAVKVHSMLKQEEVDIEGYVRRMGIGEEYIQSEEFNYGTFGIGGIDSGPPPVELISAFSTIGNDGVHVDPYVIERIEKINGDVVYEHETEETRVWESNSNYVLIDMLRDVHTDGSARGTIDQLNFDTDWVSKTGTTNSRNDVWYVASTPRISFGTWIGYGSNEFGGLGDDFGIYPSLRNRNFWATLMNAVYEVNPDVFGVGEQFPVPDDVTTDSVIQTTGMKSGNVETPGGSTFNFSGSTHTEIFKEDNVPGTTVYDFAIGATDEELSDFWSGRMSSSSDNDDDNDDNDSEDSEDNDSEDDSDDEEVSDSEPEEEAEEPESEPEPEDEPEPEPESESEDEDEEESEPEPEETDDSGNDDDEDNSEDSEDEE